MRPDRPPENGAAPGAAPGADAALLLPALQASHVAAAVVRLTDAVFVEVNAAFCRLLQRRAAQITGRTAGALDLWQDTTLRSRVLERLHQGNTVEGVEWHYRNAAGEAGRLRLSASTLSHRGEPHALVLLTDQSDQHELLADHGCAHRRFGVALRASGLLVFSQDAELRYTWVANPALGATEVDLIGRTDDEVLGAEAAAPLVAVKRRVLDSGVAERCDVWVANNGQLGCFDLVVEPERDAAGRVTGIVCAALDITQRMTSREAPADALQAAPALRAIQGMTALLGREALSPRQVQRLQRIGQAVRRLAGAAAAVSEGPALQRLRRHHGGTPVLVAEQNPVLRELAMALLQDAGLQVTAAATGVEAFSLALQLPVRLLLLDMELPQRGGVAAARAVRATVRRPLPLIAMVSPGVDDGHASALDADLDDVIERPVRAEQLYPMVLSWLEAR